MTTESWNQRVVSIPPGSLAAVGQAYLPFSVGFTNKIQPASSVGLESSVVEELKAMQAVMDNAGQISKMYDTYGDLMKEVKVFSDFQGNNKFFGLDRSAPYSHSYMLYQEIGGEGKEYICKNDIFLYLQKKIIQMEPKFGHRLPLTLLMYFMKSQEVKLKDVIEFVEFDHLEFEVIDDNLRKLCATLKDNIQNLTSEDLTVEGMLARFRKILPVRMINREMTELIGILEHLFARNPVEAAETCTWVYSYCAAVIPHLREIISANPDWFNPEGRAKCTLDLMRRNMQTMSMVLPAQKCKKVFRVFEDGGYKFVFNRDMIEYMETFLPQETPKYDVGFTAELHAGISLMEQYGVERDAVIYIAVPVQRAKHSAVPIPTGHGQFCKFASDWFFEVFRNVFFGIKAFQGDQKEAWMAFEAQMIILKGCFNPEWGRVYARNQNEIDKIQEVLVSMISPHCSDTLKDIRTVSDSGFGPKSVVEELEYLNVNVYFPKVTEHVDAVFEALVKGREDDEENPMKLKTSDMYVCVENCLMIALLEKNPWMLKFLHYQLACHRVVGLTCSLCELERENPRMKRNMWTATSDEDEAAHVKDWEAFIVENQKMEALVEKRLAEVRKN